MFIKPALMVAVAFVFIGVLQAEPPADGRPASTGKFMPDLASVVRSGPR